MAKKSDSSFYKEAKFTLPKVSKMKESEFSISLKTPTRHKVKIPMVKFTKI